MKKISLAVAIATAMLAATPAFAQKPGAPLDIVKTAQSQPVKSTAQKVCWQAVSFCKN